MHPYRRLLLSALFAAACGDDTASTSASGTTGGPTTTDTGTTDTPTSDGPTSVGPTSVGPTSDPTSATAGSSDTVIPGTGSSGEPGSTGGSTTDASSSSSGTTGSGGACGVPGDFVDATLEHEGQPAPCAALEFEGQRISDPKGPSWILDGCPCGADCFQPDPWSFQITIPPAWEPMLPECPRIVVERQMGFGGCEFAALSIWDSMQPDQPALLHAGHGFAATAAAQKELTVSEVLVDECPCEACCGPASLWDIAFDMLGQQVQLPEGQTADLGQHQAINFQSHASGLCDAPLDAHWAVRALQ